MLLFYITQKNYYIIVLYFPKIYNHTSLYGPIASGTSVDPTTSLFVRHAGITDCRKLKSTVYG
jgi:hypothetical protein